MANRGVDRDRGTCEHMMYGNPGDVDPDPPTMCGGPARFRYPAMGGGYMRLCTAHGEKHENDHGLEVWTAGGWKRANA